MVAYQCYRYYYEYISLRSYMSNTIVLQMNLKFSSSTAVSTIAEELMKDILNKLKANKFSHIFHQPVDWQSLGLFDYPEIIKRPMDLTTIEQKLGQKMYPRVQVFFEDIDLVWKNCLTYNSPDDWIFGYALRMQKQTIRLIKNYFPGLMFRKEKKKRKQKQNRQNERKKKNQTETTKQKEVKPQNQCSCSQCAHLVLYVSFGEEEQQQRQALHEYLQVISDEHAKLLFLMIQQRCPSACNYQSDGDLAINLNSVDLETISKALLQINRWYDSK